jgi:signal recognition particle subunit SRP54
MEAMAKMGSMTKIMGMLPGMGQYKEQLENFDEREVDRIKAIILSMTPTERDDPKMIDGSRRARIARGSGTEVRDVNQLVDRFFEARKMMQQMAKGGGMPGMGAVPGLPGAGKRAGARQKPQQRKKGKRVSGNPAKRAAEEKAAAARESAGPGAGGAGAFGFDQESEGEFELPQELRDLM